MSKRPCALIVGSAAGASAAARAARARNHDVQTAANALHALALLARRPVHVVLCEPHLPGRSGEWLAAEIRRYKPDTPVIVLPHHGPADIDAFLSAALPSPIAATRATDDRRQSSRATPDPRACAVRLGPGRHVSIVDVSEKGMRVSAEFRMLPGTNVEVQQTPDAADRRRGRVVWCRVARVTADSVSYEAGVSFLNETSSTQHEAA